ncbi:MAG: hypothetical protein ACREC4_11205 [Methylocella sp.]
MTIFCIVDEDRSPIPERDAAKGNLRLMTADSSIGKTAIGSPVV